MTTFLGGVANRENEGTASGLRDSRAPGRKVNRTFLRRLASELKDSPAPWRGISRTFLCQLVFGPNSLWVTLAEGRPGTHGPANCFLLGLLGRADWSRVLGLGSRYPQRVGPGPRYPQCPPFPAGEEDRPRLEKNQVDRHAMGKCLSLMLVNFQHKFCNFFITALVAFGSFVSVLRFRSSYKRRERRSSLSHWLSKFIW